MFDGVILSESGVNMIKSLMPEQPKRQRARRSKSGVSPARTEESGDGDTIGKDGDDVSVEDSKVDENTPVENEKKKRNRRSGETLF